MSQSHACLRPPCRSARPHRLTSRAGAGYFFRSRPVDRIDNVTLPRARGFVIDAVRRTRTGEATDSPMPPSVRSAGLICCATSRHFTTGAWAAISTGPLSAAVTKEQSTGRGTGSYAVMLSVAAAVAVLAGCTSYPSGATITPGYFRFVTISKPDDYGGGWREVCIHARMSQDIRGTGEVTRFTCNIGVGVPIVLHTGRRISLHEAQRQSAAAANAAAYATLTNTVGVSASTCQKARRMMLRLLQREISGARVNECRSIVGGVTIPVVTFP